MEGARGMYSLFDIILCGTKYNEDYILVPTYSRSKVTAKCEYVRMSPKKYYGSLEASDILQIFSLCCQKQNW